MRQAGHLRRAAADLPVFAVHLCSSRPAGQSQEPGSVHSVKRVDEGHGMVIKYTPPTGITTLWVYWEMTAAANDDAQR